MKSRLDRLLAKLNKYDLGADTGGGASRNEKNNTGQSTNNGRTSSAPFDPSFMNSPVFVTPTSTQSDFAGINTEIDKTISQAVNKPLSFTESAKAFFSGITGSPTSLMGGIASLINGFRGLSKAQQEAAIANVKKVNPGISTAQAEALVRGYADNVSQQISRSTEGMSNSEKNKYITNNQDAILNAATNSKASNNMQTNSLWDKYVDEWYGNPDNVKQALQADATHKSNAAKTYQDTITGANDEQSAIINDIVSKMQTGEGIYKPTSFNINGQDVSFVNRGARNTADSIINAGQQDFQNKGTTATGILGTAGLTSPSAGMIAYLDALAKAGETDAGIKYKQDALDKGIAIDQQKINQNEPSTLDQIGQIASTGKGIFDLFKSFS